LTTIPVPSLKLSVAFKAGSLPKIDPADGKFVLTLATVKIVGGITAKAARKLAVHQGGAVLSGRLVEQAGGKLALLDAGVQFLDPQPAAPAPATPSQATTP
jgi:hypothetical protein